MTLGNTAGSSLLDALSDEALMKRITTGDPAAFSTLVKRHTRRFYAAAFRLLMTREDAEDVVQDAFCKLWNGKAQWHDDRGAKFTTWFYRIVTNQAIDHRARKQRHTGGELDEGFASADPSAEQQLLAARQTQTIERALACLPERQRTALVLFYTEELSQKETAEAMGLTVKAVESLLGRAKLALKERMKTYA